MDTSLCRYCKQLRPLTDFRPKRRKCIHCERADGRTYRQSPVGKEKSVQWVENNQERMTELQAQWYQNNKEKRNQEYNERYHNDPLFKFQRLCKSRIQIAFRSRGLQKANKTVKYLNCPISWLTYWFSYCFTPEMTLENHGPYWHMDHVIPVNLFDLTDPLQVFLCFSWFNLSPLKGSENMSKHDSIDVEQVKQHVLKLVYFQFALGQPYPTQYFELCARHLTMTGNSLEFYLPLRSGN